MVEDAVNVSAVQMVSGDDLEANLSRAARLIERAAAQGAALVALPENFAFLGRNERDKLAHGEHDGSGRIQDFLAERAAHHGVWLVGGTLPMIAGGRERVRASCLVMDASGARRGRYDKRHLFDVTVSDTESYRESDTLAPGDESLVIDSPIGRLGVAVCYDLRFPELFRAMVDAGAEAFVVPSAFTQTTGAAHWEVLLRARAIENLATVVAPGQGGEHPGGRRTYGHSMIVEPWGGVVACHETGEGVATATVDRAAGRALRERFPALRHRRAPAPVVAAPAVREEA